MFRIMKGQVCVQSLSMIRMILSYSVLTFLLCIFSLNSMRVICKHKFLKDGPTTINTPTTNSSNLWKTFYFLWSTSTPTKWAMEISEGSMSLLMRNMTTRRRFRAFLASLRKSRSIFNSWRIWLGLRFVRWLLSSLGACVIMRRIQSMISWRLMFSKPDSAFSKQPP